MGLAFVEIVFEPLIEVAVWVLSAVVGLAVAELAYSLWVAVRWLIGSGRKTELFHDSNGATWSIRLTWRPWPSQWPVSSRLFGLRRQTPGAQRRSHEHWLHPRRMIDRFDNALFFVAPVAVALVLLLVAVFIVETVVVVFFIAVAAAWRFVSRRSWRVEITSPDGTATTRGRLSFREASELAYLVKTEAVASPSLDLKTAMTRWP